jgi:hypothetical protein
MRPDSTRDSKGDDNAACLCQWCKATKDGTWWHFADLEHREGCALVAFCTQHRMELPGLPKYEPDAEK